MTARALRLLRLAAVHAALGLLASGCTFFDGNSRVLVTSEPPGAEILVDGQSTGLTTPALIQLGAIFGGDGRVSIQKDGFATEHRDVRQWTHAYTAKWLDGATSPELIALPIFWSWGDFLTPFGVRWQYVPQELYVKLYPVGEAPVSADALAGGPVGAAESR